MKVNKTTDNIIESNVKGQKFGIEESKIGFIFSVLREGMYQDPVGTICREIMSNCLDAHTMAKCEDKPFEVTLPNSFSPELKFRDFGPGMSPEFMANEFLWVGTSTKDESDDFIGGWGLGRLTPWSYTDSFIVETIYKGVKRAYGCYLDETGRGELKLLMETPTDEPSGTLVKIAVKRKDFNRFKEKVLFYASYMKTKPIVHGSKSDEWIKIEKKIEGKGWYAGEYQVFSLNKPATLVVGNIPYPIDIMSLTSEVRSSPILRCSVVMFCSVGDVDVATNRENLRYTDKTINFIASKIKDISLDIGRSITDKLANQTSLIDACLAYAQIPYELKKLSNNKVQWNGYPVLDRYLVSDNVAIQVFTKEANSIKTNNRYSTNSIKVSPDIIYYLNDYSTSTHKNRIERIFEDNPKVNKVVVFKHKEDPQNSLNITDGFNTTIPMNQLKVGLLSKVDPITKPKKIVLSNGTTAKKVVSRKPKGTQRFLLYKDRTVDPSRIGLYSRCEEAIVDPSVGGYYLIVEKGKSKLNIDFWYGEETNLLDYLVDHLSIDLYLVKPKQEIHVASSNWKNLEDTINDLIDQNITPEILDFVHWDNAFSISNDLKDIVLTDTRPSLLKKTLLYINKCTAANNDLMNRNRAFHSMVVKRVKSKTHTSTLNQLCDQCLKKYPLITCSNYCRSSKEFAQDVLDYIHIVEEHHKVVQLRSSQFKLATV